MFRSSKKKKKKRKRRTLEIHPPPCPLERLFNNNNCQIISCHHPLHCPLQIPAMLSHAVARALQALGVPSAPRHSAKWPHEPPQPTPEPPTWVHPPWALQSCLSFPLDTSGSWKAPSKASTPSAPCRIRPGVTKSCRLGHSQMWNSWICCNWAHCLQTRPWKN